MRKFRQYSLKGIKSTDKTIRFPKIDDVEILSVDKYPTLFEIQISVICDEVEHIKTKFSLVSLHALYDVNFDEWTMVKYFRNGTNVDALIMKVEGE